jgi:hypothetical protein
MAITAQHRKAKTIRKPQLAALQEEKAKLNPTVKKRNLKREIYCRLEHLSRVTREKFPTYSG